MTYRLIDKQSSYSSVPAQTFTSLHCQSTSKYHNAHSHQNQCRRRQRRRQLPRRRFLAFTKVDAEWKALKTERQVLPHGRVDALTSGNVEVGKIILKMQLAEFSGNLRRVLKKGFNKRTVLNLQEL